MFDREIWRNFFAWLFAWEQQEQVQAQYLRVPVEVKHDPRARRRP